MSQLDKQTRARSSRRPPFPRADAAGVPDWLVRWTRRPTTARPTYLGTGRMPGYRVLVTGPTPASGGVAAIAMAKEGADVALNALPEEREDLEAVRDVVGDLGRRPCCSPAT